MEQRRARTLNIFEELPYSGSNWEPDPEPQNTGSPSPTTPTSSDPCAGRKGNLDHFPSNKPNWGIPHITPRHIEQTPGFQGKSYYTFGLLTSSLTAKQTQVMNMNQEAFEKGGAIPSFAGRITYVYAPYGGIGYGPFKIEGFTAGRDASSNFEFTNVRTVVVDKDCKRVITSHPGLPLNVRPTDPRIVGTPHWWDAINTHL